MKIAQVVCVFPPYKSGISNIAQKYTELLSELGHEVTVFTPDYKREKSEPSNGYNLELISPILKCGNGAFIPQLTRRLRSFDAVYLHYPFFGGSESVWLAHVLLKNKFRLVIHYHMEVKRLSIAHETLRLPSRMIEKSLFKAADRVTCASLDYVKNSGIRNIYNLWPDKFVEIPFGIDAARFSPKSKGNISGGNTEILFVGGLDRAHSFKGLEILFKSLGSMDNENWRLNIVGDGDKRREYEKIVKDLSIKERVNFLGRVSERDLPEVYRNADLFVLPSTSKNEAFGIVLLEAMASGLPVIASDLPGVRNVFKDGVQGLLVKSGDELDLKQKLKLILSNKEMRLGMGLKARALAEEKYSWRSTQLAFKNIFTR